MEYEKDTCYDIYNYLRVIIVIETILSGGGFTDVSVWEPPPERASMIGWGFNPRLNRLAIDASEAGGK